MTLGTPFVADAPTDLALTQVQCAQAGTIAVS